MTIGIGESLPGFLLDILNFGGINNKATGVIAVASSDNVTVVYSNSFPLRRGVIFGWEVKLGGTGTKAVKIELEQGNIRPVTEGLSDSAWVVPDNKTGNPMFVDVTDTNTHHAAYAPNPSAFGRLKITGLTGNDASTTLAVARQYAIKNV